MKASTVPPSMHDRLADVHELRRALADAVAADELLRAALDDELDDAVLVADDLAARVVPVERAADDRVAARRLGRLLGEADASPTSGIV